MQATDIIIILVFILPGVVALKISNLVDIPKDNNKSEFGELLHGVLWSFPILLVSGTLSHIVSRLKTVKEYINAFDQPLFLFTFIPVVLIITILLGVIKGLYEERFYELVNKNRSEKLNRIEIDNKTCWRKLFLDSKDSHYLRIKKNNETYEGFTKWYSTPDEEKEIVLYEPENLKYYPDYKKKFNKIKYSYINIEKEIVIEDYDMTEYNNWVEELSK